VLSLKYFSNYLLTTNRNKLQWHENYAKIGNIIIFLLVIAIYCGILGVLQYGGALSSHYCSGYFDNRYISANIACKPTKLKTVFAF